MAWSVMINKSIGFAIPVNSKEEIMIFNWFLEGFRIFPFHIDVAIQVYILSYSVVTSTTHLFPSYSSHNKPNHIQFSITN